MKAMILAAGKGTRMQHLTDDKPKPMVELNGKPILEYIIELIKNIEIREFLIITGYKYEKIEDYFGDGSRFGIDITYKRQVSLDGTGKVINLGIDYINNEPFLMCYGDILTDQHNYHNLMKLHKENPDDSILTVNRSDDPSKGAAVYFNSNHYLENIIEKPPKDTITTKWNNSGIYIFNPIIFEYTAKLQKSARGEYELTQAVKDMIDNNLKYKINVIEGMWSDVGNPDKVLEMEDYLRNEGRSLR